MKAIKTSFYFEIHITEHCNLNCSGCSHFSPIADEEYLNVNKYEKDCEQLSKITNGEVSYIKLLGGEPLLHKDINSIMDITRMNFRKTIIVIITNGILLNVQKAKFWQSCNKNKVKIGISKYPIKLPLSIILEQAKIYDVEVGYFRGPLKIISLSDKNCDDKIMYHFPIDLLGQQDIDNSFSKCNKSNNCFTLKKGRLYTCSTLPHIIHFINYFHKDMIIDDRDSISIYDVKNTDEILSFLSRPISFCRYCCVDNIKRNVAWKISKGDIKEWI